ncbi:o-succinylbenzoate synthase [Pelodictyon luteolum]|uniref:o-succinylbenzoate synthase n=1 Tax=Chlorobium luteolum (strain DSM 273 / BCRC 81028 / 2530) TaxID=319225 RepID=Q3B616_CHLL3|nr:o-succinylbenzoate synthase [Pelodictyon luteolum]ABB23215.1 O-succinylbenzoate-CoA synthase [Pelodictyon luteolum DSM 273]
MTASYAYLYRYSLPFNEPVTVRGRRLLQRDGVLLALKTGDGKHTAWGEIAPLSGLHRETTESAERQIVETLAMHGESGAALMTEGLFPSVRMGLEMAVMNLEASISGRHPFSVPGESMLPRVPLNALLMGSTDVVLLRAQASYQEGYRAFKLKVGKENAEEAAAAVHALHRLFGSQVELRLDANQSMPLDDAIAFARELPKNSVTYIEEPLLQPRDIPEYHAKTGIRSALDETLWQKPGLLGALPPETIGALVLKPNCLGGVAAVLNLVRYAADHNMQAVFSSAFESSISLGFYAILAAATSVRPAACGLDTFRHLKEDIQTTAFHAEGGSLDAASLYLDTREVRTTNLSLASVWTL